MPTGRVFHQMYFVSSMLNHSEGIMLFVVCVCVCYLHMQMQTLCRAVAISITTSYSTSVKIFYRGLTEVFIASPFCD